MTAFWFFLASLFQMLFKIMPSIGAIVNTLLISSGFIACFIWIRVMLKDRTPESNP